MEASHYSLYTIKKIFSSKQFLLIFKMLTSISIKNVFKKSLERWISTSSIRQKKKIDPLQEAALKENCFLVDDNDKVIGVASKRDCHRVQSDGNIPLHRAFSVFLFNPKGDLLLQKRSSTKVTYPNHYTNSCCSHPIANEPGEDEEKDSLGIIRAAQRRLNYELGIPLRQLPDSIFTYITRIKYFDEGDGQWGENEIDYILFGQGKFTIKPNPNEISAISYVQKDELEEFLPTLDGPLTPWFRLILKHRLHLWWDNLNDLNQFKEHTKILNVTKSDKK